MKATITLAALCLTAGSAFSQVAGTAVLDINNTRAHLASNGLFFHRPSTQQAGFEVPKGSGKHMIYEMSLLAAGTDVNGQLKAALTGYGASDFFSGPITQEHSQYTSDNYASRYAFLWPALKTEIDYHIANWQTAGYVIPTNILEWPGNGHILNGEPLLLAPFFDRNNDQLYDPADGDYPIIRGDKAYFTVMNDLAGVHTASGSDPIGLEVHLLFYQYDVLGALGNTTFIHAEAINRGTQTLSNFHFGSVVDFDLGFDSDDFTGTAVDHNMIYAYNGDLVDGNDSGNGYGEFPPAIGIITLNEPLYSHVPVTSSITAPAQSYNMLKGNLAGGNEQLDNNGQPTRYAYNGYGPGWTEATMGNNPGGRMSYMSFQPGTFSPGNVFCYDYAIVYSRSNGGALFSSVDALLTDATTVQTFYDTQGYADCMNDNEPLGLGEKQEVPALTIWPNPANERIALSGVEGGTFEITSLDGKRVASGTVDGSTIDLRTLQAGCYVLLVQEHGVVRTTKLIKH